MKLSELTTLDCLVVPTRSLDKFDIIEELVDCLNGAGFLSDRDAVIASVNDRERVRSTGVGHGLAIPHSKCPSSTKMCLAIGKPPEPISYDSHDGMPVELVILVTGPTQQPADHLQVLAKLSRIWLYSGFREASAEASTSQGLLEALQACESVRS